jgi:hypothetical protein
MVAAVSTGSDVAVGAKVGEAATSTVGGGWVGSAAPKVPHAKAANSKRPVTRKMG